MFKVHETVQVLPVLVIDERIDTHLPSHTARKLRKLHVHRLPVSVHAVKDDIVPRIGLIPAGIHDADESAVIIRPVIPRISVMDADFRNAAGYRSRRFS